MDSDDKTTNGTLVVNWESASSTHRLFSRTADQGNGWAEANIVLHYPTYTKFRVSFFVQNGFGKLSP